MPRKSPTTGARPHKDRTEQTHFAEDLWNWMKENQNFLLLVITLVLVIGLFYVLNSRWNRQAKINAQVELSKKIYNVSQDRSGAAEIKRLKSALQKYRGVGNVEPWLRLQLARTYFEEERYQAALKELSQLKNNSPDSPAANFAGRLRSSIESQLEYFKKELPQKKNNLKNDFQKKMTTYDVTEKDLPGGTSKENQKNKSENKKENTSNNDSSTQETNPESNNDSKRSEK